MKIYSMSIKDMRHAMAVHSPLTRPSLIPKERMFIIAGINDKMASPKHARLLWEHWDRPDIYWFPGNHLIHLGRREYWDEIERFLMKIGVVDR